MFQTLVRGYCIMGSSDKSCDTDSGQISLSLTGQINTIYEKAQRISTCIITPGKDSADFKS